MGIILVEQAFIGGVKHIVWRFADEPDATQMSDSFFGNGVN